MLQFRRADQQGGHGAQGAPRIIKRMSGNLWVIEFPADYFLRRCRYLAVQQCVLQQQKSRLLSLIRIGAVLGRRMRETSTGEGTKREQPAGVESDSPDLSVAERQSVVHPVEQRLGTHPA